MGKGMERSAEEEEELGPQETGNTSAGLIGVTFNLYPTPLPLALSAQTTWVQFQRGHREGAVYRREL